MHSFGDSRTSRQRLFFNWPTAGCRSRFLLEIKRCPDSTETATAMDPCGSMRPHGTGTIRGSTPLHLHLDVGSSSLRGDHGQPFRGSQCHGHGKREIEACERIVRPAKDRDVSQKAAQPARAERDRSPVSRAHGWTAARTRAASARLRRRVHLLRRDGADARCSASPGNAPSRCCAQGKTAHSSIHPWVSGYGDHASRWMRVP